MLYQSWHITLLGTLAAANANQTITRFRTRHTAGLLACLALYPERTHTRETLADRLWPEEAPEVSRTNLRVALSSLRRQLEPPGLPAGSVLIADRSCVRLRPGAFTTDTGAFEAALRPPCGPEPLPDRAARLARAAALYTGELLPGFYDDWVLEARAALAADHLRALGSLLDCREALGDDDAVREVAAALLRADPLEERGYLALMRQSLRAGEPARVLSEFRRLEHRLRSELGASPSAAAAALAEAAHAFCPASCSPPPHLSASPKPSPAPSVETLTPLETPGPLRALPIVWTRFFGRRAEIETLCGLLADGDVRLVTLTGPGGAGKTRLATEAGRRQAEHFPGPVCFVPLADVISAPLLLDAVAAGLGVARTGTDSALDLIAATLGSGPALLILDNLEQIAGGAAPLVQSLLARLPGLSCLLTSRRPLNLPGERVFPLAPLPTPLRAETPERLMEYAGVQLFVDRAQAARPDFAVTPRNADAVGALCGRLEGLPLALELAAAWTGVLTPAQALARLDARFELLVSRSGSASCRHGEKRHRTLHAAIAWSFDLLPDDLRGFFRRLSVFRGGWTAGAAEAACAMPGVLEALERLRERSLILAEDVGGGDSVRFRMLESLREFAAEQCPPDEAASVSERHAAFFLDTAEVRQLEMQGADAKAALDVVEAERANILAAFAWFDNPARHPSLGLRLAGALWRFWAIRGPIWEGRDRLERTLTRAEGTDTALEVEARGWNGLAVLVRMEGNLARSRHLNGCALALWRTLGDTRGIAASLNNIGTALMQEGDHAAACPLLEESLALWRALDKPNAVAQLLQNLAFSACERGEYAESARLCGEALPLFEAMENQQGQSHIYSIRATNAVRGGSFREAATLQAKSLALAVEIGDQSGIVNSFETLALAACGLGESRRPALLVGALQTVMLAAGLSLDPSGLAGIEHIQVQLRVSLTQAEIDALVEDGKRLTQEQSVALALEPFLACL